MEKVSMCQLANNFSLSEFTFSQTATRLGIAIRVDFNDNVFQSLQKLCLEVLQPLRGALGHSVRVTSGYRPPAVNQYIGGASKSQHMWGEAADIIVNGMEPLAVCQAIVRLNLPFDQLIHEFGCWTHVSIAREGKQPRAQTMTAWKNISLNRTEYLPGLNSITEIEKSYPAI